MSSTFLSYLIFVRPNKKTEYPKIISVSLPPAMLQALATRVHVCPTCVVRMVLLPYSAPYRVPIFTSLNLNRLGGAVGHTWRLSQMPLRCYGPCPTSVCTTSPSLNCTTSYPILKSISPPLYSFSKYSCMYIEQTPRSCPSPGFKLKRVTTICTRIISF